MQLTWERAVLHLDMDAFFVNVHLLDHPEDQGIPLAVGGNPNGRGVVASASYEARQFGVRSAMPSSRALRLCPDIKFVRHNWAKIKETSDYIMDILGDHGPIEKMSVDEAYVDVSHHPDPESLALKMRTLVKLETTCPASVGLASNKLVAKIASDFDKPEGCTIVRPGDEAYFIAPLPVRAISGIGPRTAERLGALNIETCGQLADYDSNALRLAFGKQTDSLQRRALGIDPRPVESERGRSKSISQERTFSDDVDDEAYLKEKIGSMAVSVAESLKRKSLVAHTVTVKFRLADFTTFTRQRSVEHGMDSAEEIRHLGELIFDAYAQGEKFRLIGIGVSNIREPSARQLELFPDIELNRYG